MTDQRLEIGANEGLVHIFTTVATYSFSPEKAVHMAEVLLNSAKECGLDIQVNVSHTHGGQKIITPLERQRLIQRVEHMLRSLSSKPPHVQATYITDQILSDAT